MCAAYVAQMSKATDKESAMLVRSTHPPAPSWNCGTSTTRGAPTLGCESRRPIPVNGTLGPQRKALLQAQRMQPIR